MGDHAGWQEERFVGEERFDLATAGMGRVVVTWEGSFVIAVVVVVVVRVLMLVASANGRSGGWVGCE